MQNETFCNQNCKNQLHLGTKNVIYCMVIFLGLKLQKSAILGTKNVNYSMTIFFGLKLQKSAILRHHGPKVVINIILGTWTLKITKTSNKYQNCKRKLIGTKVAKINYTQGPKL